MEDRGEFTIERGEPAFVVADPLRLTHTWERDVCFIGCWERDAEDAGPGSCRHLHLGVVVVKINAVVAR